MRSWCLWIARRLWWGAVAIGIAAGIAAQDSEVRTIAWGLFVLAVALSVIDQVLFLVEEREWVHAYVSKRGVGTLVVRVFSTGLPFYFVLRLGTLGGVAFLTYWIVRVFR